MRALHRNMMGSLFTLPIALPVLSLPLSQGIQTLEKAMEGTHRPAIPLGGSWSAYMCVQYKRQGERH